MKMHILDRQLPNLKERLIIKPERTIDEAGMNRLALTLFEGEQSLAWLVSTWPQNSGICKLHSLYVSDKARDRTVAHRLIQEMLMEMLKERMNLAIGDVEAYEYDEAGKSIEQNARRQKALMRFYMSLGFKGTKYQGISMDLSSFWPLVNQVVRAA